MRTPHYFGLPYPLLFVTIELLFIIFKINTFFRITKQEIQEAIKVGKNKGLLYENTLYRLIDPVSIGVLLLTGHKRKEARELTDWNYNKIKNTSRMLKKNRSFRRVCSFIAIRRGFKTVNSKYFDF